MIITFLGTGGSLGIPVIACDCEVCKSENPKDKRLRTSIHIEAAGQSLIIDSGPDFRQQVLRENIKKLDAIIYTHQHKDHIAGLDDVRSFNFFQQKPMPLYVNEGTKEEVKRSFHYAFSDEKYPGVPQLKLIPINKNGFSIDGINITPIEALHHKMPVFGFRIGDFTYLTDANYVSKEEKKKMMNSKVLVLNAIFKKKHHSHFNLEEAIELSQELEAEKTYIIHMSHRMGLHDVVNEELPENIELAYDRLKIHL